ncbi:MAG: phospho-N-acetylmuramoyl-pentapeptide-transferase [Candidatus Ornithomonoglobus sp.]
MKEFLGATLLSLVLAFAITAVLGPAFIKWLHKLKFGQEIREEGPAWHQKKSGTPTMGGIMFIVGTGISVVINLVFMKVMGNLSDVVMKALVLFIVSLGFGAIGFVDDYIKVVKKRNLGLTALQKFLLQLAFAAVYVVVMYFMGLLRTDVIIPFVRYPITIPMWLYIPFVMFVVVGTVNAVNLTDGLDGLASSITAVVAIFFAAYAFFRAGSAPEMGVSIYGMALLGGLLGFLIFNKYPAKVFMGDTGSLFLGGAVALMAVDLNMHLYLIIAGFIYFAETLSVIIQTSYFKYTKKKYGEGRRVFLMTPIHHHFEKLGWKETKVVGVFTLVTFCLCVIAFFA